MSDVERVDPPEAPVETPPEPQVEAVDSDGVPFKNRAEEFRRKYEDQLELNQRYQRELGTRQAQPPPQVQQTTGEYEIEVDGAKHKFDRASVELIRRLAREESNNTAQSFVGRSQLAQEVADQEVRSEAEKVYREEVLSNPWYASWNDDAKQAFAIKEGKFRVLKRQMDALKKGAVSQSQQQAAQQQASAASLPGTGGGGQSSGDRDRYIKEFMADPEQRGYLKSMWKMDPDSPQGQEKLRRTAEFAWKGSPVSEKFAQGIELLRKGGR